VAKHAGPRGEVNPAHGERDSGAARGAKVGFDVRLAVAVRVTQGEDAARPPAPVLQGDEDVPVGGDREVPRRADVVGDHNRAESRWQRQAAVVSTAGW